MKRMEPTHKYDDIIDLPHPTSYRHARMSRIDRAAQFSPFAALTGYDAAVRETARLTDVRRDLDDTERSVLNEKLRMLRDFLDESPQVRVTYFVPDSRKQGGEYVTVTGEVKQLDEYSRTVVMADGSVIPMEQIREIRGELFEQFEM